MPETLHDAAVSYARDYGLAVVPLVPRQKRPATEHGFNEWAESVEEVEYTWGRQPQYNVGATMGAPSGNIVCIDIDIDDDKGYDGMEFLREWEREHGELPETVSAITGRGGCHLYYRVDREVRPSVNDELHIDIRGDGSGVVLPPSVHPDTGRAYEWENHPEDYPFADADENVYAFLDAVRKDTPKGERFKAPEIQGEGGRDETLFKFACSLQAQGISDAAIKHAVHAYNQEQCRPPLAPGEVDKKIASALKYEKGCRLSDNPPVDESNPYIEKYENGKQKPLSVAAIKFYIEKDPKLEGVRFETLSNDVYAGSGLPWNHAPHAWNETDDIYLFARMQEIYRVSKRQDVSDAMRIVAFDRRFDILQETLNKLPEWDGLPRAETVFVDFLGAKDTAYNRACTKLFLRGAVQRAFKPGVKFDYMIVLIGAQGIGKSTVCEMLSLRPDFFSDNVREISRKEGAEALRGRWIVEMSELASFQKAGIEDLKAFISRNSDDYRPPYAKRTEKHPRRCVFIGTTNESQFLSDITGNRRFLPIECREAPILNVFDDGMRDYIEQVWAEVLFEFKQNPNTSLTLDPSALAAAKEMQAGAMVEDPRVGLIGQWLESTDEKYVCALQICERALGIQREHVRNGMCTEINRIVEQTFSDTWRKSEKQHRIGVYGKQRCFQRVEE